MHEARLYERRDDKKVKCHLCAHGCLIKPGGRGICQVRENQDGTLYTLVWGKPIAANLDPIEKKPLYHFLPGSTSLSIATVGCNFQCGFCQNWDISQQQRESGGRVPGGGPGGTLVEPAAILAQALSSGAASISYTYTEPTIYFEYAYDCMQLAVDNGLKNVFVTNGYESPECVEACQGLLHAANVDLKAMNDDFYRSECKAHLAPVLATLKNMRRAGVWLEVTTLLIPGKNDDPGEVTELAAFLAGELGPEVPWHISAYTPRYKYLNGGPGRTPVSAIEKALDIGRQAGLKFVYGGNVMGHASEGTACPSCGEPVIRRVGYTTDNRLKSGGACPHCGHRLAGVWA
ncbi:MAG: AmmeMemoRadiSam system radical SAM enzyme [Deltaproteobacteria bacterium]|nr:AmmeMemoRadiSam system radical SAM enzyme [Deltaproteobacteria bacterium]